VENSRESEASSACLSIITCKLLYSLYLRFPEPLTILKDAQRYLKISAVSRELMTNFPGKIAVSSQADQTLVDLQLA
jgi:hypothetical protein